jgi:signal peptidase I
VVLSLVVVPSLLGYPALTVQGGSMGDSLPGGSLAITRWVPADEVEAGDVIVIKNANATAVIHRVVSIEEQDGAFVVETKGDANRTADPGYSVLNDRVAVHTYTIPYVGYAADFLRTPLGWTLFVLIPIGVMCSRTLRDIWSTEGRPPGEETRLAFLQAKARERRVAILQAKASERRAEVLRHRADRVRDNIRALKGCLNRVVAYARHNTRSTIDLEVAQKALAAPTPTAAAPATVPTPTAAAPADPQAILEAVAEYYSVPLAAITGKSRAKQITEARQVGMYLLREDAELALKQIGLLLGHRRHTTVIRGVQNITRALTADPRLSLQLTEIRGSVS